jgi:hypothetical protein
MQFPSCNANETSEWKKQVARRTGGEKLTGGCAAALRRRRRLLLRVLLEHLRVLGAGRQVQQPCARRRHGTGARQLQIAA